MGYVVDIWQRAGDENVILSLLRQNDLRGRHDCFAVGRLNVGDFLGFIFESVGLSHLGRRPDEAVDYS